MSGFSAGISPASISSTQMKHTTKLGPGRYIRLDSYGESRETRRFNILCTLVVIAITCMTATAMVGVDITNLNPQQTEGAPRINR
jgi:hypothetical protein